LPDNVTEETHEGELFVMPITHLQSTPESSASHYPLAKKSGRKQNFDITDVSGEFMKQTRIAGRFNIGQDDGHSASQKCGFLCIIGHA